mgnify:CR=1 FL=1
MDFAATRKQVEQIICNAINASIPVGLGVLQYEAKRYTSADIKPIRDNPLTYSIDYFHGRMVKLGIKEIGTDKWRIMLPEDSVHAKYQSWAMMYPSVDLLVKSVLGPRPK